MRPSGRFKQAGLLIVAVLTMFALAACGSDDEKSGAGGAQAAGPAPVKLGIVEYTGIAPTQLGLDKGIFEKHGIDLELVPADTPAAITAQVLSGQLDMGFATTTFLATAAAKGAPLAGGLRRRRPDQPGGGGQRDRGRREELDPVTQGPHGQEGGGRRARLRARRPDEEGHRRRRRRLVQGAVRADPVPADAGGAERRPGRRDRDDRAVPDALQEGRCARHLGARGRAPAERLGDRLHGVQAVHRAERGRGEALPGGHARVARVRQGAQRRGARSRLEGDGPRRRGGRGPGAGHDLRAASSTGLRSRRCRTSCSSTS